jgi:leukotriene-A4 hydrolase
MVDECAWEFADTEKFVAAGEALCGPYKWGVYDLLVLPPSFPYGGMENPCLTFVTPTLLAKDRSQVHVVAHEVSHSWSGNLVTNETWEHFWLNEGLTVFTELKIIRDVFGAEESQLQLASRLKSLTESVNHFGADHNFTRLVPDLSGGLDPDDAFSTVPYIKGMALFTLLECLVGGESEFQPFIKAYFEKFGGKTVTSEGMRDFFMEFFRARAKDNPAVAAAMEGPIAGLDWEKLLRAPGLPEVMPLCDASPIEEAKALAKKWVDNQDALDTFSAKDIEGWSTTKITVFLDQLLSDSEHGGGSLSMAACERMAERYAFLSSNNCEVCFRFLRLALGAKWEGAKLTAIDLATRQGRMKFTRPLYRALKGFDTALARETFEKHRTSYHPICAKMVARDLEV